MSDERKTQETPDARSFEGRVFARFDALDNRLGGMDERLQALEAKQHDTKPIWERALAEIAETRAEVGRFRAETQANFRKMERQLTVLGSDMLELRGAVNKLELRMDKLDESRV